MKTVILLGKGLNKGGWEPITAILSAAGCGFVIADHHDKITERYDLGILLGYSDIVPPEKLKKATGGFVLFHSSDLPAGRGWAPIYYTIRNGLNLVQTQLFASPRVDAGLMIAKGSYELDGNEMEGEVREIDDAITLSLLEKTIIPLLRGEVKGVAQDEDAVTRWDRRRPEDSRIDAGEPLGRLMEHLRALPYNHPAFIDFRGRRFLLRLEPESLKTFDPAKIKVERFF